MPVQEAAVKRLSLRLQSKPPRLGSVWSQSMSPRVLVTPAAIEVGTGGWRRRPEPETVQGLIPMCRHGAGHRLALPVPTPPPRATRPAATGDDEPEVPGEADRPTGRRV